ncbi:MAG: cob(I)yrinic acid a,c-diamide adenosyltransferase [Schleiferiaceae bacterium]
MKIYTKTGDSGKTSLLSGTRVEKYQPRIDAYGTLDELNSWMGMVRDHMEDSQRKSEVLAVQDQLFSMGSHLASEPGQTKFPLPPLHESWIADLETAIDSMNEDLPPLTSFILPGGHVAVSHCHLARTVCRRAERGVVYVASEEEVHGVIPKYLNRLSDYLFVLSRWVSAKVNAEEIPWVPEKSS